MIIPQAVFGIGMGLMMAHLVNLILSSAAPEDSPEASGLNNAMDQLGNSLGTAVVGSLLLAFFLGNVVDGVLTTGQISVTSAERTQIIVAVEDAREVITATEWQEVVSLLPAEFQEWLAQLADRSVVMAMEDTLLVVGALLLIMLLLSTFLAKRADRKFRRRNACPTSRLKATHRCLHHL